MIHRATRSGFRILLLTGALVLSTHLAFAGFGSTETFLPAVGRVAGQGGAQFYTTVWATNLTTAPETFTFRFLKQGQANGTPASFQDTLQPGETKVYENVVESKLGLADAIGAARVTSTGPIFVSERIFNQAPGADLGDTEGLFFAGVPQSFSISAGQSASIQGINQGGSENFRYNFALVETGGGSPTVNVQVFDGSGTLLGQKAYTLQPYEQLQPSVIDVVPSIATTNARITATVTSGTGSALLAGAQLANISQDSSGFEMTFRDELLGSGGGLTAVIHDTTLVGNGTSASPLGVNPGAVVTSLNGLHGGLTLSAGSNVTITPSGSTLTIASTGGGSGGLSLPFTGSSSTAATTFAVSNTGGGQAIEADSNATGFNVSANPFAIKGVSTGDTGTGVYGSTHGTSGEGGYTGVWGDSRDATAVTGTSLNDRGVLGITGTGLAVGGVEGLSRAPSGVGVIGRTLNGTGQSSPSLGIGVWGDSTGVGVYATGSTAVRADSEDGNGVALLANNGSGGNIALFESNGSPIARIDHTGKGFFDGGTQTGGADVAEFISGSATLGPGDVVEIDFEHAGKFRLSSLQNSSAVAGVISTDPGVTMNAPESSSRATEGPKLALAGRVPVKVTAEGGPIRPGDLLVASSTPGHAMKAPKAPMAGTIIGKALGGLSEGEGVIEMLVMLR